MVFYIGFVKRILVNGRDPIEEFIEGFALYGTYESENALKAAKEKLKREKKFCEEIKNTKETPEEADLSYGKEYYLKIKWKDECDDLTWEKDSEIRPVFIEENDGRITVDMRSLNKTLSDF
mgnify:CR=1 FL=1